MQERDGRPIAHWQTLAASLRHAGDALAERRGVRPSAPPTESSCSSSRRASAPICFTQVGRIDAWVPIFLFSVLFGLCMDYKVFLLSRIHERCGGHRSTPPAQWPTAWRRPHA
jgi:uncharacterized membrane protein YdfJ with MMPL/SSD domain